MEQIEKIWPGWEVVRKIGSGSFGSVYEIRRDVFGREEKAALKVLSIPESQEEIEELYNDGYDEESITTHYKEHLADIVREYSLMLEMKGHTNVVYCDDVKYVQHDDGIGWDIYIKMELLTPLTKVVPTAYDEAQTVRLGVDLCNALMLCKQQSIVHRDIKPQNIFVSRTGDYKLGDFGVAKISDKTATGTKVGTFDYMAPEVYRGGSYGSGADIYSLGLVLYWMMNQKRTPFLPLTDIPSASAKEEARNRRFHGEALPEPANGSDALKAIVLKACAFDPKDRYQTAAEMREDLKKLDTGAVLVPPVIPAASVEPVPGGEVTMKIFSGRKETAPEEGTVNLFGSKAAEGKTEYIQEEKTEYIRDEKTEYITCSVSAEAEKPKKKKKLWLIPVIAGVLVAALLITMLRSCGQPAGTGETTGSMPGTTQVCDHSPSVGGCTDPVICMLCGEKLSEAPGHEWTPVEENAFTLVSFRQILVKFTGGVKNEETGLIEYSDQEKHDTKKKAELIIDEWRSGSWDEASFAVLATQYSDDAASSGNGGLYENVYLGQLASPINEWCFYEETQVGDFALIQSEYGFNLLYLVSRGSYTIDNADPQYCVKCHETNGEIVLFTVTEPPTTAPEQTVPPTTTILPTTVPEQTVPSTTAPHVHTWKAATCTEPKTCSACGATEGSAAGHKWAEATYTTPKTCTICKLTEGKPMGKIVSISASGVTTVGLRYDGTVSILGSQAGTLNWDDIVSISAGAEHTVGLKRDGTVVAVGSNEYGQCNTSSWRNIIAVSAGTRHTVGLKEDGTVVATGDTSNGRCDVMSWSDIIAVSAGMLHTVGLRADGTVVATGYTKGGQCNVSSWTDIVAISASFWQTVGLKSDGTVVATGSNSSGQCNVSTWRDIVFIAAGANQTVGIRSNGTVVAVGDNTYGQCDVSDWSDVVSVASGGYYIVGLKADGTVIAIGNNDYGQCDVAVWNE